MDKISKGKVWRLIQNTGDTLKEKLPHNPNHPKSRNPYAHVALKVKTHFGCSYNDIADEKYKEVVDFLDWLKREEG